MSAALCTIRRMGLAIGFLPLMPWPAPGQSLTYVGGLQYGTGNFVFTQRVWSAYLSSGFAWTAGRFRVTASMPLVLQPQGSVQYGGSGMMIPTGGAGRGSGSAEHGETGMRSGMRFGHLGIGDPFARLDAGLLHDQAGHARISLVGAVKAPLADVNRGFGTGEWDVGAGLSGAARLRGTLVLAEAVYWKLGNPPGGALRNAVAYAVSAGRPLPADRWSVLAAVSGATSFSAGLVGPVQAGLGIGYRFPSGRSMFATASAGLTRSAPTMSAGLGWHLPLGPINP